MSFPKGVLQTVKQTLVDARQGQGKFRRDVLRHWDYECTVTGVAETAVIQASHIKSWKDSSNEERLDPLNGLPLVPSSHPVPLRQLSGRCIDCGSESDLRERRHLREYLP